jgi:uroporphyrinogen III methyltransferase/synthase
MRRIAALGYDARRFGGVKLAAIGPATAEELKKFHLLADVQPGEYRAEALADALAADARGKRFLLARASRGREVLAERLSAAGAIVEQICVYDSQDVDQPAREVIAALEAGRIYWTTVTSSAIARSLVRMFGDSLTKTRLAAISPLTAEVLTGLGHLAAVVADTYTSDGIIDAILAADAQ